MKSKQILLAAIAGAMFGSLLPAGSAAAYSPGGAIDNLEAGYYTIKLMVQNMNFDDRCLIQANNGTATYPERHLWQAPGGKVGYCGFPDASALDSNGQALFQIIPTQHSKNGIPGYVLKNKRSGHCLAAGNGGSVFFDTRCSASDPAIIWLLDADYVAKDLAETTLKPLQFPTSCMIFGNNGQNASPNWYRWNNVPSDQRWCGLGDFWTLSKTKQAMVYLTYWGKTKAYANETDFAILDYAPPINSPITVSGRSGNAPSNAQVAVNITHTFKGDLKVDLVAPDGTVYVLSDRAGGGADNIIQTFTVNLSSEALNGTWNLRVIDLAPGDRGTLNTWSMAF